MDLQLSGKTALVTGASQGIGRAIAISLASEGVRTAIAARRGELLNDVAEDIAAAGHPRPIVISHDIMPADGPESLAAFALDALGTVDILVNSAGGSRKVDLYADVATWDEGMNMNFNTQRRLSHTLLPQMIERKWGRIITISVRTNRRNIRVKLMLLCQPKLQSMHGQKGYRMKFRNMV